MKWFSHLIFSSNVARQAQTVLKKKKSAFS